jgi:UPF0716 protein FxsA
MPAVLVLIFVLLPLAEILVIVQVGSVIGGWWTAGLLIADSLLGAYLLRVEGRRAWREFRTALEEGRWPGDEVAQGALIIVGGTLLLTPGFITDAVGFLFLLGPTRRMVARRLRSRVGAAATAGPRSDGRGGDLGLDVEVVEIRREQPPTGPVGDAARGQEDGREQRPPALGGQGDDDDDDPDSEGGRGQGGVGG